MTSAVGPEKMPRSVCGGDDAAGVGVGILFFVRFYDEIVQKITKRKIKYGANSIIITVVVIALVVIVYLVLVDHNKKFDLTGTKRFSLSDQTEKVLESLTGPVKVYAFFSKNQETAMVVDLLGQYHYIYKDFDFEIIDPDLNPGRVEEMGVETYGEIIIDYGGKTEKVKSQNEEGFTNALIKLSQKEIKKVYFVKGHGERSLEDYGNTGYERIKASIKEENFEVGEILLLREEAVPEDCAVLVTAGPTKDYEPHEREMIKELLQCGRNIETVPRDQTQKTPDFKVDGVETEHKRITKAGKDTLKNAIEEAAEQGDQILIDARGTTISSKDAAEQILRAEGNVKKLRGRVTVLTCEGPVGF